MATYRLHGNDNTNAFIGLIFISIWLAALGGWIANIVKVLGDAGNPITGWFIARIVGVFLPPVGSVLGYL